MGCVPGGAGALARADAYPVSTCWPSSSGSRAASVARNCSNAPHSQRVRRVSLASVRQHPAQVRPVARHLGPEGRLAAPARAGAGPRLSPAVRRRCRPGGGRTRRDDDRPGEYQVVNQHALGRVSRPEGATGCYARLATSRRRRSSPAIPRRVTTPEYQRRAVRGTPAPDAGLRCRSLPSLPGRYRPSFAASALGVDAQVIWCMGRCASSYE
jgi:hypothetical protein